MEVGPQVKYLDAHWMNQLDREAERRDRAECWRIANPSIFDGIPPVLAQALMPLATVPATPLDRARAVSDACTEPPITVTESNTEAAWADWDHATEQLDRKEIQA